MSKAIVYCHCGIRSHGQGLCRKHYQELYRDAQDERYFTSPKGRYQVLKHNAKIHNREVGINFEEFKNLLTASKEKCYYCNGKLGRGSASDRIDNSKGYLKNNIVICCDGCNSLKSELLSLSETLEIVKLLKKVRNREDIWK